MEEIKFNFFPWDKGEKPYFKNPEGFEWYKDKSIQNWIDRDTESAPKLKNVYAFLVKKGDEVDRVLINDKQQVIYSTKRFEDMCVRIDILKITEKYDKAEGLD